MNLSGSVQAKDIRHEEYNKGHAGRFPDNDGQDNIRPHAELSILLHALPGVLSLVQDNGTRSSIRYNLCFSLLIRLCLISVQHKAEVTADGCTEAEMQEIS